MSGQVKSLQKAFRMAKKYIRINWDDGTQIFLAGIKESDQAWVFKFFPFIPKNKPGDFSSVHPITIHGIEGCVPIYYGGHMNPVLVDKKTGAINGLYFHYMDYKEGKVEQFFESFHDVDVMVAFLDRKSKGLGYSVKWLEK